jgi:hypothetical protein
MTERKNLLVTVSLEKKFLTMFPEGGQTRKHCYLAMFSKGGKTRTTAQYTLCIMTSQGLMPARNAGLSSHRLGKLNNSKWPLSKVSYRKTSIPRGHQAL